MIKTGTKGTATLVTLCFNPLLELQCHRWLVWSCFENELLQVKLLPLAKCSQELFKRITSHYEAPVCVKRLVGSKLARKFVCLLAFTAA